MMPLKHSKGRAAFPQSQGEAAGMLNHPRGNADDFLHHRSDAAPLGKVAHRTVRADQGGLADSAQDVEGQHRQRQHQIVGRELARRLNADLKQEMGKRVPVRTKARLREAASEHMAMLEQNPERVIAYFQDRRVRYAA